MRRRALRIGAAVLACVVTTGCGGDDGGGQELSAADQAHAERINLRAGDIPRGWVRAPAGTIAGQGGGEVVDRVLDDCLAPDRDAPAPTGDASSGTFRRGSLLVTSRVTIAASEPAARAGLAALGRERAGFCLKQAVERANREIDAPPTSVDQTTTTVFVGAVTVEPIAPATPAGIEPVAWRARVELRTVSGAAAAMTSDRIFFVRGRALVAVTFSSAGSFPADLQQRVLSTLAARA
jgi:hypothetical protein